MNDEKPTRTWDQPLPQDIQSAAEPSVSLGVSVFARPASKPLWNIGPQDPDCGLYRAPARQPGEQRQHNAEYRHPEGGWASALFTEDDNGCRWLDYHTGKTHEMEKHPGVLIGYYDGFPWRRGCCDLAHRGHREGCPGAEGPTTEEDT